MSNTEATQPKKKRKLTLKERKFVKGIAEGKTQTQAYIETYDTKGHIPTVEAEASRTASKPHVREAIEQALAVRGITMDTIVAPVADALTYQDSESQKDQIEVRLKGHDRAVKLLGIGNSQGGNTFNFVQVVGSDKKEFEL